MSIFNRNPLRGAVNSGIRAYSTRLFDRLQKLNVQEQQKDTLLRLVQKARATKFGRDHEFGNIKSIHDYQRAVPLRNYEYFWQDYWQAAFPVVQGITWPEEIRYFALTSGTTTGSTKYIPVSPSMLRSNRQAAMTLQGTFFANTPQADLYQGNFLFLGGSTDLERLKPGIKAGDLSGIVVDEAPRILKYFTFPPSDIALESDWTKKLHRIIETAAGKNITGISGVPSWVLILFAELKKYTGKETISQIWPGLQLVIHGGVKFDPYRAQYEREIGNERVRFLETYPCSEGFIAFEDLNYKQLRLMAGHGLFYEFVPVEELNAETPVRHTVFNFETGVQYAVVLSTCAGLWSYVVGDTISFESLDPPLLRFTGRTKYFLSAFGEHLISEEIEKAVTVAVKEQQVFVTDFHVGPVFAQHSGEVGYHLYLLECDTPNKPDLEKIARQIDQELAALNADYKAHRAGNVSMHAPKVVQLRPGAFAQWMKSKGKLGGQHKVPRMDNSGELTRQILEYMRYNNFVFGE